MTAHCHACGSRNLRPSRPQPKDLVYFITLRYPVRCRRCRRRFAVSIFSIRKVQRDAQARNARNADERRAQQAVVLDWRQFEDFR